MFAYNTLNGVADVSDKFVFNCVAQVNKIIHGIYMVVSKSVAIY